MHDVATGEVLFSYVIVKSSQEGTCIDKEWRATAWRCGDNGEYNTVSPIREGGSGLLCLAGSGIGKSEAPDAS